MIDHLLLSSGAVNPKSRNSGKSASRPSWINKELLAKTQTLKGSVEKVKAETDNLEGIWRPYVQSSRDVVSKAKAQ